MSNPTDWTRVAEEFKANARPRSGFFTWEGEKSVEEEGVLIEFARALESQDRLFFSSAFHRGEGNDPPDCEAVGLADERIGIELTELIDPGFAAAVRTGEAYEPRQWTQGEIASGLEDRIAAKDMGKPKDGPYDRYILLIYSDEPGLPLADAEHVISNQVFPASRLLSDAYFLMPYDADSKRYPCLKLSLVDE